MIVKGLIEFKKGHFLPRVFTNILHTHTLFRKKYYPLYTPSLSSRSPLLNCTLKLVIGLNNQSIPHGHLITFGPLQRSFNFRLSPFLSPLFLIPTRIYVKVKHWQSIRIEKCKFPRFSWHDKSEQQVTCKDFCKSPGGSKISVLLKCIPPSFSLDYESNYPDRGHCRKKYHHMPLEPSDSWQTLRKG